MFACWMPCERRLRFDFRSVSRGRAVRLRRQAIPATSTTAASTRRSSPPWRSPCAARRARPAACRGSPRCRAGREQGIASEEGAGGRWSIDHLFLDQDGVPTLVEVKRGTDTRIRREVVGQMLDYAANAVLHWPVDELRARFAARCAAEGAEPGPVLRRLIASSSRSDADARRPGRSKTRPPPKSSIPTPARSPPHNPKLTATCKGPRSGPFPERAPSPRPT